MAIQSGITVKEVVDTIQVNMDKEEAVQLYTELVVVCDMLIAERTVLTSKLLEVLEAAIDETLKEEEE